MDRFPAPNSPTRTKSHRTIAQLEPIALASALIGTGAAILWQQPNYAVIPLSLHAALLSSRQRHCQALCQIATIPPPPLPPVPAEPVVSQTPFTLTLAKLREVQTWQREFEIRDWPSLTAQIKDLQAQVDQMRTTIAQLEAQQTTPSLPRHPRSQSSSPPKAMQWTKRPHRPERDRLMIFIDASNLYHSTPADHAIRYSKLVNCLRGRSEHCRVRVYTSVKSQDRQQVNFIKALKQQGFHVIPKEVIRRTDGTEKANLDVELAIDLVQQVDAYDTAILVSGDRDFLYAIHQAHGAGKRVEVASFQNHTSPDLIQAADSYLNLEACAQEFIVRNRHAA